MERKLKGKLKSVVYRQGSVVWRKTAHVLLGDVPEDPVEFNAEEGGRGES